MMKQYAVYWVGLRPWKRHSLVLMVGGLIYIGVGISYIFAQPNESREIALQIALSWMPLDWWGFWFVISGLASIVSSRWPPISKTWGYTALTGLAAGWCSFYLFAVIWPGLGSPPTNLSGAAIWGLVAFLWWAISGLVNPPDILEDEWTRHSSQGS